MPQCGIFFVFLAFEVKIKTQIVSLWGHETTNKNQATNMSIIP
jgi:hypothetical protein